MTEEHVAPRAAANMEGPSLFDAVAAEDHEAMVNLYASQARNAISAYLAIKSRWCCAMSSRAEEPKSEEKLDEYFQHVSSRGPSRLRYRESFRYGERQWGWQQSDVAEKSCVVDESLYHGMMDELGELIVDEELCEEKEQVHPLKKTKKQHAEPYPEDVERLAWEAATVVSNVRPPSTFVVNKEDEETAESSRHIDDDTEEERPALFDGSIANSTPPPLIGAGTSGGGAGTILHLSCAIDSPFALAILLAMGADAGAPHTAFRRLMMHEAACCGSWQCLELLLSLGEKCAATAQHRGPPGLLFPDLSHSRRPEPNAKPKETASNSDLVGTNELSFLSLLNHILELSRKVRSGDVSQMEAAQSVLAHSRLPESTVMTLAKSCVFSREKDAPFVQQGYADGHGNTALHWAAFKNETRCVSLLLQYQADPNARAHPSGWTPLHDAAYSNAAESLMLLLEAGAQVDSRANSGATPLCFAAQEDAAQAVEILLDRGANLSARCCGQTRGEGHQLGHDLPGLNQNIHHHHGRFSGYTPLHYCAHYNAWRAARLLLNHSSAAEGMEIPDLSDRLPIHVAVARGSSDVLRELLHGGARVDTEVNDEVAVSSPRPSRGRAAAPASPVPTQPAPPQQASTPTPQAGATNHVGTPVSSPVLRSMIPSRPVMSSKPWNCLSQRSIDECRNLIAQAEQHWSPNRHALFTPTDRRAVLELLRVGKRLEQMGTGIFLDLWPLVLSFCGRGWFEVQDETESDSERAVLPRPSDPDLSESR